MLQILNVNILFVFPTKRGADPAIPTLRYSIHSYRFSNKTKRQPKKQFQRIPISEEQLACNA
jgi:hypothetical protein